MCGIVGSILSRGSVARAGLIEGLRVLEYRGYDSAGVAVIDGTGIAIRRKAGRIENARGAGSRTARWHRARAGIGHTRWATHGGPATSTRTRTPTRRAAWRWCTTACSRTTPSCAPKLVERGVKLHVRDRHRECWRTGSAPSSARRCTLLEAVRRSWRACAATTPSPRWRSRAASRASSARAPVRRCAWRSRPTRPISPRTCWR